MPALAALPLRRLVAVLAPAFLALLVTTPAVAAVPPVVATVGVLTASGGPVADGDYALTFRLYTDAQGGQPAWEEGPLVLTVQGGRFTAALGAKNALTQQVLAALPQAWLGVQVGNDPELPRLPLRSTVFALRSAVAEAVDCSGCIGALQLDPKVLAPYAKASDLEALAKTADLAKIATSGAYKDLLGAPKLADVALSGAYADLASLPTLAKVGTSCGTGLVVRGLLQDGSLDCVAGVADAASLPANGLAAVSNGLLTNVFTDSFGLTGAIDIPDASLKGVTAEVTVPDVGKALALTVHVVVTTSKLAQIKVILTAPDASQYLLHDQAGQGTKLDATYPKPNATLSGDLGAWAGKNPAGVWKLQVIDLEPGAQQTDGQIQAFSIDLQTLSNQKVAATGALLLPTGGGVPGACTAGNKGQTQVAPGTGLYVCDGNHWQLLRFEPLCGNGLVNAGEECDDGNGVAGDGCTLCKKAFCGDGVVQAGEQCDKGAQNSDTAANACRTSCMLAKCGDKVVDSGEACDDGNQNDGDGCSNTCATPCNGGWVYDGVCLKSNSLGSNADAVPGGCSPYQPAKTWSKTDFVNICEHFKTNGATTNCNSPDSDADGGLCSNFQAVVSWESNGTPDVWLHNKSFTYNPVSSSPQCKLKSDDVSVVVYACQ